MQENRLLILSTRPLEEHLISVATKNGFAVDALPFITTTPVRNDSIEQTIQDALQLKVPLVFTSMNAVEVVAEYASDLQDKHVVYCIGNTTSELVKKYFGENAAAATADNADMLADKIIADKNITDLVFFCGDRRRDDLPHKLKENKIKVKEIEVYHTESIPHKIKKQYAGILFFSPSAVYSFFTENTISKETVLFAIGTTTADAIRQHTKNKIIIADKPGKENLLHQMMKYFTDLYRL